MCITIEGGTLKEGEITGLPYQYKDENGQIRFRFLPYYAVERIQAEEKRLFELSGKTVLGEALSGDENRYAQNELSPEEKIAALQNGTPEKCCTDKEKTGSRRRDTDHPVFRSDEGRKRRDLGIY